MKRDDDVRFEVHDNEAGTECWNAVQDAVDKAVRDGGEYSRSVHAAVNGLAGGVSLLLGAFTNTKDGRVPTEAETSDCFTYTLLVVNRMSKPRIGGCNVMYTVNALVAASRDFEKLMGRSIHGSLHPNMVAAMQRGDLLAKEAKALAQMEAEEAAKAIMSAKDGEVIDLANYLGTRH